MWYFIILSLCLTDCLAQPSQIVRPCKLYDYKCIGENLAANSECSAAVSNQYPNRMHVPQFKFDAPYFNSTYIEFDLTIANIDRCYVVEFFIDQATSVIVLGLECPLLGFDADRLLIQHWSLREDTTYTYHYNGTYPLVRMTANLNKWNQWNVCFTNILSDVTALPFFHVDPKDQKTANFLTKDLTLLNIYEIENFFVRGRYIMRDFVNSFICNYGCHYIYKYGSF